MSKDDGFFTFLSPLRDDTKSANERECNYSPDSAYCTRRNVRKVNSGNERSHKSKWLRALMHRPV